ncbi:MAG: Ltp family lipoprotein [Bacteroidales bacterium]|nr:Ltp family lipoprotein [Bacteroidales bacterium]
MTFLFILCLTFSFVLLWLSSYSTNDTLQLIFFISAGLLMFIGGFGLLRLKHKAAASNTSRDSLSEALAAQEREIALLEQQRKTLTFSTPEEEADADRRLADLKRRHAETVAAYRNAQVSRQQKTDKLTPAIGIITLLSTVVYSIAVPSSLAPVQDVSSYAVSRITSNADSAGLTLSQYNAVRSARSYLNYSSFSRSGLIKQLEFEKFSTADAEFAVDYLSPDWYAEAAEAAASYLRYSSFSADGLVDQLMYEGFTRDQANYGVKQVGY